MSILDSWKQIPQLADANFLVINITNKHEGKYSQETYDRNISYIKSGKQSGYWTVGKNTDYHYVVLFFREKEGTRIFLGKKTTDPTHYQGRRYIINVDQWKEIGSSESSIGEFCKGLPVSANPVLIWRRDAVTATKKAAQKERKTSSTAAPIKLYCRICWNSKNWREPTGEAQQLEKASYVSVHGYGHEEWLFDWSKILTGYADDPHTYKYGFLQPIGKFRDTYVGKTMDILLYTVAPKRQKLIVAKISNVYIPDNEEISWVFKQYKKNGWLDDMENALNDINLKGVNIHDPRFPEGICNIRFSQGDVTYFEPKLPVPDTHKINKFDRYHPMHWDDDSVLEDVIAANAKARSKAQSAKKNDPKRSEDIRTRAAIEGTEYSPNHVKIQNALYEFLKREYGKSAVQYEVNYVDLCLRNSEETVFFEIKTAPTAKRCVREALGQLLEYAHYADQNNATKFVVIGDASYDNDDITYMKNLRTRYQLPVYYRQWIWGKNVLSSDV